MLNLCQIDVKKKSNRNQIVAETISKWCQVDVKSMWNRCQVDVMSMSKTMSKRYQIDVMSMSSRCQIDIRSMSKRSQIDVTSTCTSNKKGFVSEALKDWLSFFWDCYILFAKQCQTCTKQSNCDCKGVLSERLNMFLACLTSYTQPSPRRRCNREF